MSVQLMNYLYILARVGYEVASKRRHLTSSETVTIVLLEHFHTSTENCPIIFPTVSLSPM